MRVLTPIALTFAGVALASAEPEKPAPTPVLRPTHANIVKKRQEQNKENEKAAPPQANAGDEPLVKTKKRSLINSSTLLTSFGKWTLIPRGSIIYLPKRLQDKITTKPEGELVNWKIFLHKNRGWIHLHPVTMVQAQGKETINPKTIKAYQSIGKIIVATCAGGPISVAPSAYQLEDDKKN